MIDLKLAPSILSADFSRLGGEIEALGAVADSIHVDVMDGHFVPNLTIGPAVVASIRKATDLPLDCHLMVESPKSWFGPFADSGADSVTFHLEAVEDPSEEIAALRELGINVGMAISPDTPFEAARPWMEALDLLLVMSVHPGFGGQSFIPSVLGKVRSARDLINAEGLQVDIQIDGGIGEATVGDAVAAGANILVAGSAIFGASEPEAAAWRIMEEAMKANA